MRDHRKLVSAMLWGCILCPVAALPPDHPVLTEIYTDPNGANDGPVGRDPTNAHQEYIEFYLPVTGDLRPGLNKDALRLTFYEVEGDVTSGGNTLVNYRLDLPTFDLDPGNGLTSGAIARPSSGVVVLGWADPGTGVGLVNGGITSTSAYVFIALNGSPNFRSPVALSLLNPGEDSSGIIQNGSSAYLLVNRDDPGYVELYDDEDAAHVPPVENADPRLADGTVLQTSCLQDALAGNDDSNFIVTDQPLPGDGVVDLDLVLPQGGAFSQLVAQLPESESAPPAPGIANGYARNYVDLPKTTETADPDDPAFDASTAYRPIRNDGPFFPTPGRAASTTSPPELAVARAAEQSFQVLVETTARPAVLAANVGGNFGINVVASPGASSNPAAATFAAAAGDFGVFGQEHAFPAVAITAPASATDGASTNAAVSVSASNASGGDPAVVAPVQATTVTATVLKPTSGMNALGMPFQTTVFAAVQAVPAQAGVTNEFRNTSLGAFVAANLGGQARDTFGNGSTLANPATDIGNGPFVQLSLVRDFPDPGSYVNAPGPGTPGTLDLRQTVLQSAEVQSGAGTYDGNVDAVGVRGVRVNTPDTLCAGGGFTPSETVHFADPVGGVGGLRNGLSNATTTRGFEIAILDTNVRDDSSLETGATDDFGIVVQVASTNPGADVVPGEFVFLSFTGGLQGADIDTLEVPPGPNVATVAYLDLDNLNNILGIRSLELMYLIDGGGSGEVDPIEVFSLHPDSAIPCSVPADCDDGIPCTVDSCNPEVGCTNAPNHAACDNGVYCDGAEVCNANLGCQSGTPRNCNDGIACTIDACNEPADACDHFPNSSSCNNGLFCDGVESCSVAQGCVTTGDPCLNPALTCDEGLDACIGCQNDPDCNDGDACTTDRCVSGACESQHVPGCGCAASSPAQAARIPNSAGTLVTATADRTLSFSLADGGREQAVRVTFVGLPGSYSAWNGRQLWLGDPRLICEQAGAGAGQTCPPGTRVSPFAPLQCTQVCRPDWSQFGALHAYHRGIVPGGSYRVEVIDCNCDPASPASYSPALNLATALWGDLCGPYVSGVWTAPNGSASITADVIGVLEKFGNRPGAMEKHRADVEPGCLDFKINITDATRTLDAFRGLVYPFVPGSADPCTAPCP